MKNGREIAVQAQEIPRIFTPGSQVAHHGLGQQPAILRVQSRTVLARLGKGFGGFLGVAAMGCQLPWVQTTGRAQRR